LSHSSLAISDLLLIFLFFLLSALEGQLAASYHETEEARLCEVLLMEDCECAVVARIRQGASVTLATLQLRTGQDFHQVAPRFLNHARHAERGELVGGFATTVATVMAAANMVDILRGDG
jgi:hypothetical protein